MNLLKNIQNTCFQNNLFQKNSKIILAVSGGPDSVCLLDVFSRLQKKYSLELAISHVNYNLRGIDSQKDENFVKKLAEKYNLEFFVFHPEKRKKYSENSLRQIRYDFFEKLRQEKKFDFVAVAHNADDQVETFLMRLIRGAGTDGLSAMKFKNNFIIRPLLEISREEILKYLQKEKKIYRTDKTNKESKFFRNKIRNKLIPYLEKNFNPKIKQTILSNLVSISEDAHFLNEFSKKTSEDFSNLDAKEMEKLPSAILKRILRQKIEEKTGSLKNISSKNIKEILKVIRSKKNKIHTVKFRNLKITRRGDKLEINNL